MSDMDGGSGSGSGSGDGHSPSEQEQVAQLARALRSDITLVLRTLDDILDKFALLEVLVPRVRRAAAAAETVQECTESALESVISAGEAPVRAAKPAKITPEDIGLVEVHEVVEQQEEKKEEEEVKADEEEHKEEEKAAPRQEEPLLKRRLRWLLNKLFPTQQRFNPDDPFIQQTLCDMGFEDEERNAQALHDHNGVMPRVLDALLATATTTSAEAEE